MNATREWPRILQFGTGETITEVSVEKNYRKLAKKYHPDAGGTTENMQELNRAKELALAWIARERHRLAVAEQQARRAPDMAAMNRMAQQYSQAAAQQQQHGMGWANMGGHAASIHAQEMANAAQGMADHPAQERANPEPSPKPKTSRLRRAAERIRKWW